MTSRVTFLAPGSVVITTPVKTCLAWGGMRATTSALVHWPRAGAHYPPAQGLFRSALLPVYRIKIDNIFVARQSTLFISRKTWPQINRRIIKRLMQRLHMTSWQPCWCSKTMKRGHVGVTNQSCESSTSFLCWHFILMRELKLILPIGNVFSASVIASENFHLVIVVSYLS